MGGVDRCARETAMQLANAPEGSGSPIGERQWAVAVDEREGRTTGPVGANRPGAHFGQRVEIEVDTEPLGRSQVQQLVAFHQKDPAYDRGIRGWNDRCRHYAVAGHVRWVHDVDTGHNCSYPVHA